MSKLSRSLGTIGIDRRAFLQGATLAAASAAALAMTGCNKETAVVKKGDAAKKTDIANRPAIVDPEKDGKWVAAACWHKCGGRCVNKVCVVDGAVVRQKTDDSHEDSPEFPQQRSCVRGHSQQQQCFGADRIKYPMKRKNWEPGGGKKELRGKDEWVRISWDEAFKLVGDELNRIYEEYGPRSVLFTGGTNMPRLLNAKGGSVGVTDTTSMGTYTLNTTILGLPLYDIKKANDRFDLENADYIVLQGCNPAWASGRNPSYHYLQAKKAGVKFVMIAPSYNATAQYLDARLIPVRPGTDTAFLLGLAYEMMKLDEKDPGSVIDKEFLDKYTVGYDADHMPQDAKLNENFSEYVLGKYDGTPKTAEWASEICGTPVEDIRWLAEVMGKKNKVTYLHSFAHARNYNSENIPQLFMTIGAMGGHFGKSGHACGDTYHSGAASAGPSLVSAGPTGMPATKNGVDDLMLGANMWESLLKGKYRYIGNLYAGKFVKGEDRDIDIRCIYHEISARLQNTPNLMKGIEAHRKVDLVVAHAQFLTTQAKYADIVLPVTTEWERVGGVQTDPSPAIDVEGGNREALFCYTQVTKPLYEAKTDQQIGEGLAAAMGLDPKEVYPVSEVQQFMNKLLGATYKNEQMEDKTLVTITADDLKEWGCEGAPQEGIIDLKTMLANGCYQIPRKKGDAYTFIGYKDFIDDPENNRLPSKSGKFEIYCQAKADLLDGFGFSKEFKPYANYTVPVRGYETTFSDFKNKVKGEYPYLLYNPHYYRRSHSTYDNVPWLRETWPNPVFLSAQDAKEKGVKTGDPVMVWTEAGKILRTASVVDTLMPGIVGVPHGAWVDLDDKEEVCHAGADNVLCPTVLSAMGVSGYNNHNCNFEKYDGPALAPDCDKPQRIIEL